MAKELTNEEKSVFLDKIYGAVVEGLPYVDKPINELVAEYKNKYTDTEKAIKVFVRNQKLKCSTTGFVTGLGGLLTLPVTIPADLASSLYIELRMIAAIAAMRGYNVQDDAVKTLVYICIVGNAAGDVLKQTGIKIANQYAAKSLLPKLTREIIVKINKAVGFRLITKGGTKGLINVGRAIPVLGGIVGGTYNYVEVAVFAKKAKKFFD